MKSVLTKRVSLVLSTAVAMLSLAGVAQAGDCRDVKFHFTNSMSSKIKVRGVEIVGNDGTWTEDISNQEIDTNKEFCGWSYSSPGRTLMRLSSTIHRCPLRGWLARG